MVTRHKAKHKKNNQGNQRSNDNIVNINDYKTPTKSRKTKVDIIPRNEAQEDYIFAIEDCRVVFGVGPAGTGKTYIPTLMAIKSLKAGEVEKIVMTRPMVSVDEDIGALPGALPGDIVAKTAPWARPIVDILEEFYHPTQIASMMESGIIEFSPLGFMRGRTFKNSFIIFDEAQNATVSQMKMVLTRIGQGSQMVIIGDLNQHDRGFEANGLKDFIDRSINSENIDVIEFSRGDIERDEVVADVLEIYGEE